MGKVLARLLSVSEGRTSGGGVGFSGSGVLGGRVEAVSRTFLAGYHAALSEDRGEEALARRLEGVAAERRLRGFAFEGAGYGLAVRDVLTPWRRSGRLGRFFAGAGAAYVHLLHVGAGWAMPRAGVPWGWLRRRLDPELAWLAFDGYGFHEGYFRYQERVGRGRWPRRVSGYGRCAFDQGLGRCLWFGEMGEPDRIARRIDGLAAARRNHLWSGVGLAATYAGGGGVEALGRLVELAGESRWALGQGSAFAATTRRLDASLGPEQDLACTVLCGLPAAEAAALTDRVHARLPSTGTTAQPRFELWRRAVQEELGAAPAAA